MTCPRFLLGCSGCRPARVGTGVCGTTAGTWLCPRAGGSSPGGSEAGPGSCGGPAAVSGGRLRQARPLSPSPGSSPAPRGSPAAVPGEDSPDGMRTALRGRQQAHPRGAKPSWHLSAVPPAALLPCSVLMGCDVIPAAIPPRQRGTDACSAGELADALARQVSGAPWKTGT